MKSLSVGTERVTVRSFFIHFQYWLIFLNICGEKCQIQVIKPLGQTRHSWWSLQTKFIERFMDVKSVKCYMGSRDTHISTFHFTLKFIKSIKLGGLITIRPCQYIYMTLQEIGWYDWSRVCSVYKFLLLPIAQYTINTYSASTV